MLVSPSSRSSHGRQPRWSSWPCVMTIASMSSTRARRYAKSGSTRSMPICSAVGKRRPASTSDDPALVLDDRHVLADLAHASQREDAQGAAHAACTAASRPWRSSMARTAAVSASSASTIGSRSVPASWPSMLARP